MVRRGPDSCHSQDVTLAGVSGRRSVFIANIAIHRRPIIRSAPPVCYPNIVHVFQMPDDFQPKSSRSSPDHRDGDTPIDLLNAVM